MLDIIRLTDLMKNYALPKSMHGPSRDIGMSRRLELPANIENPNKGGCFLEPGRSFNATPFRCCKCSDSESQLIIAATSFFCSVDMNSSSRMATGWRDDNGAV